MNPTTQIKDEIIFKLKEFKKTNKNKEPQYLILGRDAYFILKDILDIPPDDELPTYSGFMIHLTLEDAMTVKFL